MKKVKFEISGMTCSSCQSHVEKAVSKLEGVSNVSVNLVSNNMTLEYDEAIIKTEDIINAVIDSGYGATLSDSEKNENGVSDNSKEIDKEVDSMKKRLLASLVFWIPLMYVAMYHMFYEWFGIPIPDLIQKAFHGPEKAMNFAFTQFLLVLPIIYLNRKFFIVGFKRLFKRSPNMDSLVALGSTAAIVYGIFAIYMIGNGHPEYRSNLYFESAGTILTLITIGKYLETKSKGKTNDAISKLIDLVPKTAVVIRDNKEKIVQIKDIFAGDIVVIKPGSAIPVDGIVIEGSSYVDQASITGESIPVAKNVDDELISGTVNKQGYLKMKATKVGEDTTLSQIIKLVEEAGNSKAPISKIADRVSYVFVPIVMAIAILSFIIWFVVTKDFEFALTIGISVLVIACPCSLGLATPVAIMVAMGKSAENGILVKSAESLETLHLIDTVVLDKTGTITKGEPKVVDIITREDEKDLLKIAGSLEKNSEHPLAKAILEKVREEKIDLEDVTDFESVSGRGIKGKINKKVYFGGNANFMKENNIDISDIDEEKLTGKTGLYFADEKKVIGVILIADIIKDTSKEAIKEMKNNNLKVVMITGDNKSVAESIGKELEIDEVISEVLPQDKEKEVARLQDSGRKVLFVGDGINDSPALTKADVGMAIGSGTDIAIESADVVLIKNSLLDVVTAVDLGKATINNIKLSLFWAFIYNIIGIPVAAGVFYNSLGLTLNPMIGAGAMSLSSVCVVTNALRLRRFKNKYVEKNKEKNKMETKVVNIEGMHCDHCKMTVEKVLSGIDGVQSVEVNLEKKQAIINSTKVIDDEKIKEVITDAGFEVK